MNQDEVKIARSLCQYILNGEVVLHEPDPPFDRLPKTFKEFTDNDSDNNDAFESEFDRTVATSTVASSAIVARDSSIGVGLVEGYGGGGGSFPLTQVSYRQPETIQPPKPQTRIEVVKTPPPRESGVQSDRKLYKIVSVDDSPTVLREISRFLEQENFSVVTINDPVKAVMSIIRNKPDLILLDLNMDGIDGYELCKIIRNNSMFKKTPIIMVTGNKGLIDKVKARLVGASGYLTKPFTQADLLKIVFMHLT